MSACENLLEETLRVADLNEAENHLIQYYISAMAAKFPALSN